MLEQAVVAGGGAVAFVGVARGFRSARTIQFRGGPGTGPITMLFRGSSPDPDNYVPDTGDLTRQIVGAMRRLGHASITQPVRALAPHLHVEGDEADINALVDFEATILADIQAYVKANGQRYRWTMAGKPALSYSVAPDSTQGVLHISRSRPLRSALGPGPARDGKRDRIAGRPGAASERLSARPATAPRDAGPQTVPMPPGSTAFREPRQGLRPVATRPLGADDGGTARTAAAGSLRLLRVGGGNVYHLAHGLNVAGRDADRCDIVLGFDDAVSAVHAEIAVLDDGIVTVRDLGSSNGTALDGRLVNGEPVRLQHGSVLTIGTTRLRLISGNSPFVPTARMTGQA